MKEINLNEDSVLLEEKSIRANCGVFGIYNHPKAAIMAYYGLHALQHRGQEAAGIVTSEYIPEKGKHHFNVHKGVGLVLGVFGDEEILTQTLRGTAAIGHNRYSTTGSSSNKNNIQPFKVTYKDGNLALSHNGNLTNANYLRKKLQDEGTIFQTTTDTEIILHLLARSKKEDFVEKILDVFRQIKGSYSICILTDDKLIAARDPLGIRPFVMGKLDDSIIFASETTSLDILNAEYVREVDPGEVIVVDREVIETGNVKSYIIEEAPKYKHCIFEYIYFSRPDSQIFKEKVDKVRRRIGANLAIEKPPPDKDNPDDENEKKVIIINVPDSSNTATLGYFNEMVKKTKNLKHEIGLIRSHYVGRTFIEPGQDHRQMKVKTKFNVVKGVLENRKVVIVDDSIVRGTTLKLLVDLIKKANPKEIHLRITSPPIVSPCYYGMDFPSKDELIANQYNGNVEEIRKMLGVESLEYLSVEQLLASVPRTTEKTDYCTACFTREYPLPIEKDEEEKAKFDEE
ncbi:MAG: amidophosphoribosyltransferase [Bacteroidetes bacterium]|nr:amidophosphoribosyltransferase [Bacteroidota bacterium]